MDIQQMKLQVNRLLSEHHYDEIKSLLLSFKDITERDNTLAMTCYLCTIYEREQVAGARSIFDKIASIEELIERYTRLKFFLRRIDFDVTDDGLDSFYSFIMQWEISSYELLAVIDFGVVHKDKVLKVIKGDE